MAISYRITAPDIFTPANAITLLGAALTLVGALQLNMVSGLIYVAVGRALDVVDGPVARRTHTSHFGAILDATTDKVVGLALLIAAYHFKLVPVLLLLLVFIYHLAVSAINLLIEARGTTYTSKSGKKTMFCHVVSILLFVASSHLHDPEKAWVYGFAVLVAVVSIWYMQKSVSGYVYEYRKGH